MSQFQVQYMIISLQCSYTVIKTHKLGNVQDHYFIWQMSHVTFCGYSALHVGSQPSGLH